MTKKENCRDCSEATCRRHQTEEPKEKIEFPWGVVTGWSIHNCNSEAHKKCLAEAEKTKDASGYGTVFLGGPPKTEEPKVPPCPHCGKDLFLGELHRFCPALWASAPKEDDPQLRLTPDQMKELKDNLVYAGFTNKEAVFITGMVARK